ncbi:MAG: 50S ribosomal protein L10 [Actinomycetota bacterium]
MGARAQKVEKVKELTRRFREASGTMFADFRGLTVKDAMDLRRSLRDADTSLFVTKNTLTRIAVKEAGLDEQVLALLEGPTAVAFISGDPVSGAKALVESSRRFPALVVKGAIVEGRVLAQEQAQALATLDTKEVSFAKVAGLLSAPLARLAYLLQAPIQRLAYGLAERGRHAGEAPQAEATPEPEAPQAEATPEPEAPQAEGTPKPEAPQAGATTREEAAPEAAGETEDQA